MFTPALNWRIYCDVHSSLLYYNIIVILHDYYYS